MSRYKNIILTYKHAHATIDTIYSIYLLLRRECIVAISYNKLWKLMIDHNMNKTQLRKEAGLSTNVIAKLSKNDAVSMDTLIRICKTLHCDVGDIVEVFE